MEIAAAPTTGLEFSQRLGVPHRSKLTHYPTGGGDPLKFNNR